MAKIFRVIFNFFPHPIRSHVMRRRWRWIGHVTRQEASKILKVCCIVSYLWKFEPDTPDNLWEMMLWKFQNWPRIWKVISASTTQEFIGFCWLITGLLLKLKGLIKMWDLTEFNKFLYPLKWNILSYCKWHDAYCEQTHMVYVHNDVNKDSLNTITRTCTAGQSLVHGFKCHSGLPCNCCSCLQQGWPFFSVNLTWSFLWLWLVCYQALLETHTPMMFQWRLN